MPSSKTTPPLRGTPPREGNDSPSPKGWQAKPDGVVPKRRFPEFRDAGEWEVKTLEDIAKISSGGTPSRAEPDYWGGSIPWITTSLIDFNRIDNAEEFITTEGLKNSSAKLFPAQTLLMAMYGQGKTRGKVALLGIEATTNQACAAIMLDKEIDTNFVFQNLASRYDEIRKLSNEGGQENLSAGLIKEISLIHPCLAEQQKIADCLASLDELLTLETQKLDTLKTHKKGLMQQLFPTEGETLPKLRFPEFRDAGEWEEAKLGDTGKFTGGGTPSKDNTSYWEGKNPWISSSDISEDSIHEIKISRFITDEAIQETATKLVPPNSILLVSRVGVGKLAITHEPICTSQDFTNFTPAKDDLVFMAYYLKSLKKIFISFNQGMAIKGFTKEDISSLEICLPQLEEQQKIADCFSSIDELIAAQAQKLDTLKTHKKGLMQQLFPSVGGVPEGRGGSPSVGGVAGEA